MAESFIFSVAESLIVKLASRAYEEASRVVGVYNHLRDMENTLSFIKAVLLDAEAFPLRIWVCVSDDFDLKHLIIKIFNAASTFTRQENLENLDVEQLQNHLRKAFGHQKFLLVMDDVWNEDRVKWIELRNLIQVGAQGSKVLVTTRSHSIGKMMDIVSSCILQGFSHRDSLSLFVKWAFKEGEDKMYPELVEIGKDIVRKCGGLPLAVRTLGSSLFLKVDVEEWIFVRDNEIWNLEQNEHDILPVLKFSYDQLPSYLKRCFACLALYPKDHVFHSSFNPVPWEVLGLLPPPDNGKTLDDVAKQCLYELQSRSFLQDFIDLGGDYTFTLHDLVHDLALYVAKDEFRLVNSHNRGMTENVRHLSFMQNNLLGQVSIPIGVRTILFSMDGVGANNEGFLSALSRYRYLRVLDLYKSEYESLPRAVGKLKHLRFFSVEFSINLKRLPDSVCKLQNLQFLKVSGCVELQALPKRLGNLISLRQLHITTKQFDFPGKEISKLTSLETLTVYLCENMESLFKGLQLSSLKKLGIDGCQSLKSLQLHVKHIPNLEVLYIGNCPVLELSKGLDSQI